MSIVTKFCIIMSLFTFPQGRSANIEGTGSSCGRRQLSGGRQGRLVNGKYTYLGEFPWQVEILYKGRFTCGGVLLTDIWALTAAHCVTFYDYAHVEIRLGEHILNSSIEKLPMISRNISKYITHPTFILLALKDGNDLTLLQFDKPVDFQPHIQPICLPMKSDVIDLTGKLGIVTGWGRLAEKDGYSSILRKLAIPIIDNEVCERIRALGRKFLVLPESLFICAGYKRGKLSVCDGDSGGPLQLQREDGSWFVAGIVSWSHTGCADVNNPTIFTKIITFIPWIRRTIYKYSKQII